MKKPSINPVERAVLMQKWDDFALVGRIQIMMGDSSKTVTNYAGRMMFVALACALAAEIDSDDVDVRVIRGAVNALHDHIGNKTIPPELRASLSSGVNAALRVADRAGRKVVATEICKMELRLRVGHLSYSDFQELVA